MSAVFARFDQPTPTPAEIRDRVEDHRQPVVDAAAAAVVHQPEAFAELRQYGRTNSLYIAGGLSDSCDWPRPKVLQSGRALRVCFRQVGSIAMRGPAI
jgi:hypothetical protein